MRNSVQIQKSDAQVVTTVKRHQKGDSEEVSLSAGDLIIATEYLKTILKRQGYKDSGELSLNNAQVGIALEKSGDNKDSDELNSAVSEVLSDSSSLRRLSELERIIDECAEAWLAKMRGSLLTITSEYYDFLKEDHRSVKREPEESAKSLFSSEITLELSESDQHIVNEEAELPALAKRFDIESINPSRYNSIEEDELSHLAAMSRPFIRPVDNSENQQSSSSCLVM